MLFHHVKLWGDFNMRPVFLEEAHKAFYFGPYKWKNRQFNSKQKNKQKTNSKNNVIVCANKIRIIL